MSRPPALLVDVGSTVVKTCTRWAPDRFSLVRTVARRADLAPGEQVAELVERRRGGGPLGMVRVCSSANGGVRVGVLGLSHRHSVAAATRAVLDGGGNVVYRRVLAELAPHEPGPRQPGPGGALGEDAGLGQRRPPAPAPAVDVLVLVGGVDGADQRRLRAALPALRLDRHPHRLLVWAGADTPDLVAALAPHRRAPNVLDDELRPRPAGLTALIRDVYLGDLVDAKGLGALQTVTDAPIWPTPAVVNLAAERMARRSLPPSPTTPFVVVDVGGATTDVFACAELRGASADRGAPGESVVRHVFPDLGVASSAPTLLYRLASEPELVDLAAAVAPERARALYHAVCDQNPAALAAGVGFLSCLFLALRRVAAADDPHRVALERAASVVITGGAWRRSSPDAIRRVVDAARGTPAAPATVLLDRRYALWAYGVQQVPARVG